MKRWRGMWAVVSGLLWATAWGAATSEAGRLVVAVTEPDIEAIVKVVGGSEVDTVSLFRGCILRRDLAVEPGVRDRLVRSDAVVWTGFFNESAAIYESIKSAPKLAESPRRPTWIDVSRGASRVNVPISTCEDYVEVSFMYGDPFFRLNPKNGGVIARNIAEGLAALRPDKRGLFMANARSFRVALNADIQRWQQALRPFEKVKIFSTQCGWQNFGQIGGPAFATCKGTPGQLPLPEVLAEHVRAMGCEIVLLDPNLPPAYGRVFREQTKARVVEVPSSLSNLEGATRYQDLFDNFVKTLVDAMRDPAGK